MHRLYLQIYAVVLASLLIFALLMGAAFWYMDDDEFRRGGRLEELTRFAEAVVPPADADPERLQRFAQALADPLDMNLTIYGPSGEVLARVGNAVPPPPPSGGTRWLEKNASVRVLGIALPGGRWVILSDERDHRPLASLLAAIGILGLATGMAAFPVARRLTRRVESLTRHVDAYGEGRLGNRVPVEGRDEIAGLAHAFNRTAERIEHLVADKTRLLANTSHELRTPLTRIRMALALLAEDPRPELVARIDRDIEELDELIGELLVASRLDAPEQRLDREPVDLLALAAEEAARIEEVEVTGTPCTIEGDPRLLRRLIRNLFENAVRHGRPPVEVQVRGAGNRVCVTVSDRGDGIPEADRERIFEPFYRPAGQASAEGGIGLGLALVRQIAERHAGRIRCEPRDGGGTRFVLDLPLDSED